MKVIDVSGENLTPRFVLCYGHSGTGKTHLAGTLAYKHRVLFIDIDQGAATLAHASKLAKARDNITVVSFDVFGDLDTAYKLVKANDPAKWSQKLGTTFDVPFDWIVWDTWSEIQYHMMEQLRAEKDHGKFDGRLVFRKNVEIQHWGMMTDLNKMSIQELRKCGNVKQLFLMQETMIKDEVAGTTLGGPAIHGKLVNELPPLFDVVIRTGTDTMGRHTATTKSKGKWPAKTRFMEGKDFVDPTMEAVLGL